MRSSTLSIREDLLHSKHLLIFVALTSASLAAVPQSTGWRAKPEVVERTTKQQPEFNFDEARVA